MDEVHEREPAVEGRERVLREARRLFIARGYAEASMREIADAAGVTKPALYYHFRDKDDLLAQVFVRETERLRAGMSRQLAAGGTLREQMTRVARLLLENRLSDHRRLFEDFVAHAPPDVRRSVLDRPPPPHEELRPTFEQALASGEIRPVDPDLAIGLFLGAIFSQIGPGRTGTLARPAAELAADIVDLVLRGIAPPD